MEVLESIMILVPLQDVVSARGACRAMRDVVDSVCKERGLRVVIDSEGAEIRERSSRPEDGHWSVGHALWLCGAAKASWLHHLACVGSPYQVALALRLGEEADGSRVCALLKHSIRFMMTSLTPLMAACALGRRAVAEVLLEVSGAMDLAIAASLQRVTGMGMSQSDVRRKMCVVGVGSALGAFR